MEWFKRFWTDHGDRLFFMGLATIFGVGFLAISKYTSLDMMGEGKTILIGIAMICFNKARGVATKS